MKKLIIKWLGLADLRKATVDDLKYDLRIIFATRLEALERRVWELEHGKTSNENIIVSTTRNHVDEFVNNEQFLDNIVKRIKDKQL